MKDETTNYYQADVAAKGYRNTQIMMALFIGQMKKNYTGSMEKLIAGYNTFTEIG